MTVRCVVACDACHDEGTYIDVPGKAPALPPGWLECWRYEDREHNRLLELSHFCCIGCFVAWAHTKHGGHVRINTRIRKVVNDD